MNKILALNTGATTITYRFPSNFFTNNTANEGFNAFFYDSQSAVILAACDGTYNKTQVRSDDAATSEGGHKERTYSAHC